MEWEITYYNEKVEAAILKLPQSLLAKYAKMTELMQEFGPNLGLPHTKVIGHQLLELRLKSKEGIGRVLYCTITK